MTDHVAKVIEASLCPDFVDQYKVLKAAVEQYRTFLWFNMVKIESLGRCVEYKLLDALLKYYEPRLLKYYNKGFRTVAGYDIVVTSTDGTPTRISLRKSRI